MHYTPFPLHIFIQYAAVCSIANITNVIIFLCKLYWQIMTSIKQTRKHEKNIMIRLNNYGKWMSEYPTPKSKVSACSERIRHESISVNKYWKFSVLAGVLCRIRYRRSNCVSISSALWLQQCLLSSDRELKKFISNKLWKGNQKNFNNY